MAEPREQQEAIEEPASRWLRHHPRAADASLERLRELAGIIQLKEPVPFTPFLDCEDGDQLNERAGN